jgi:hypothetical protein
MKNDNTLKEVWSAGRGGGARVMEGRGDVLEDEKDGRSMKRDRYIEGKTRETKNVEKMEKPCCKTPAEKKNKVGMSVKSVRQEVWWILI